MGGLAGAREKSLIEQIVELLNEVVEYLEGFVHGVGLFHVDAGAAEEIEWVFGAAAFEEAEVIVQFRLSRHW